MHSFILELVDPVSFQGPRGFPNDLILIMDDDVVLGCQNRDHEIL